MKISNINMIYKYIRNKYKDILGIIIKNLFRIYIKF